MRCEPAWCAIFCLQGGIVGKFLTVGGWDVRDLAHAPSGDRESSTSGGDSDACSYDPVFTGRANPAMSRSDAIALIASEYDRNRTEIRPFAAKVRSRTLRKKAILCLATIVDVAASVRNGDVVVIFGRDMFPCQEILRVLVHKLRGTWIYVEGCSRSLAYNCAPAVAILVHRHLAHGNGRVFGVDSGFAGTVPVNALRECKADMNIRLASGNNSERCAIRARTINPLRTHVLSLEHYPKPFLRATELDDDGWPVLRMSRREDALDAALLMEAARLLAEEFLPLANNAIKSYSDTTSLNIVESECEGERFDDGSDYVPNGFPCNPPDGSAPIVNPWQDTEC